MLLVVCFFSITMGSRAITLETIWNAFVDFDPARPSETVIREMRVPRTLLGLTAGAALGLSGAILQGVTRNPLADPGIMGINAGAAASIVVGITLFGTQQLGTYIWLALPRRRAARPWSSTASPRSAARARRRQARARRRRDHGRLDVGDVGHRA